MRFPLRTEVESCNNTRLAALPGPEYTYNAVDSVGYDYRDQPIPEESANILLDRLVAVPKLSLKVSKILPAFFSDLACILFILGKCSSDANTGT